MISLTKLSEMRSSVRARGKYCRLRAGLVSVATTPFCPTEAAITDTRTKGVLLDSTRSFFLTKQEVGQI